MLDKFLTINKKIFKKTNSKKVIALVNRERTMSALEGSTLVSAIANKKNLNVIIISDKVYESINSIYNSFGFYNFFYVSNFKNYLIYFLYSLISLLKTFNALFYILKFDFSSFIRNFKLKGILIGDLIYDTYIRNDLDFLRMKPNLKFLKITFFCCFKVLRLNNFFSTQDVKYLFIHTDCYAKNEALSMRLALKKKIKVLKIFSNKNEIYFIQAKSYEVSEGFLPIHRYFTKKSIIQKISYNSKKLSNFIIKRFHGNIYSSYSSPIDLFNANKSKTKLDKFSLIKKIFKKDKKFERIVLFAPHAFSDAPHHFGDFLFRDYWDQFIQTIDYMKMEKFENYLWLVRPHPSSYLYKEENLIKEYIKNKFNNIKLCDSNLVSTKNLIDICDTVITGRGTIGLEFACFGKKPIIAGKSTYSKFGIANEFKNKKEYFKSFTDFKSYQKLNNKDKLLARKMLFYIEMLSPLYLNKKLDHLIMRYKEKSIFNFLNHIIC